MIQYMKALGMPLKEIKQHMKKWDTGRLKQLLVENRETDSLVCHIRTDNGFPG